MTRPAALTLLAVALVVAGAALPSLALFAAGCALGFAAIGALVCVLAGAHTIRVSRRVPLREVEEGGSLTVFLSTRRSRWWPLRVEAWVDDEWRPMGSTEIRVDVGIGRRGPHELAPTAVRVIDALGLADRLVGGGTPVHVLALPRPTAEESAVRAILRRDSGPDLELGGLRPYVPGTQLSRIHWRSLARGGELVQRDLAAAPSEAAPLVVVDTHGGVDRDAVDWAARTAAGAVTRFALARGCRVLLPGDRVPVHISSDLRGWPEVLRRLALLEASARPTVPRSSQGSPVISIRGPRPPAAARPCGPLRRRRRGGRPVSPTLGPTRRATGGPSASAFAGLALFGVVAWVPVAGLGVALRLAVLAALAFVVATSKSRRIASLVLVACAPVAWLLTGLSPTLLAPWHWAALGAGLTAGMRDVFPAASDAEGLTVWSRAAALGILVMFWLVAAVAARRHQETGARTLAFLCLTAPVALSILARGSNDQAWLGAAVVPLALAWYRPRRVGRGLGATTAAAAAVVAVTVAGIAGPRDGWLTAAAAGPATTEFRGFDPSHSYGPLLARRDGTTLLRVDSHEPAYWRVRVLSQVDRRGWHARRDEPDLPEPAAHRESVEVEVRALRSRSIVTPGDVVDVAGVGTTTGPGGEVNVDRSPLGPGESYRVDADVTRASPAELSAAPAPTNDALRAYTAVELTGRSVEIPLFGTPIPSATAARIEQSPYRRTLGLALRLARGADTPLDVVDRVQGYLQRGFRYDTDVVDGDQPLDEFLFSRHSGYCQHFSGAAALLLRLAGVPARVVTGFAPGRYDSGRGVWQVRDLDAHSWVEVYFEGLGWIPVDPTPSGAPASVPPAAQPLLGDIGVPASSPVPAPAGAVALVVPVTWGVIQVRRHRRRDPDTGAIMLLRALAGGTSPLPPGATFSELGRSLERLCGPETARLAHDLEARSFRSSAPARAPVRLRGLWQALRRDRGLVRGSCLAAHAVWLVRDQTALVADHQGAAVYRPARARRPGPANGPAAPTGRPGSRRPGLPATGAPPPRP